MVYDAYIVRGEVNVNEFDLTHIFVNHVKRRLIDQPNIETLLPATHNGIPRPVEHFSKGNNVTSRAVHDGLVLSRHEFIIAFKEPGLAILLKDVRNLRPSGEDEAKPAFKEDTFDDGYHLQRIGREI